MYQFPNFCQYRFLFTWMCEWMIMMLGCDFTTFVILNISLYFTLVIAN